MNIKLKNLFASILVVTLTAFASTVIAQSSSPRNVILMIAPGMGFQHLRAVAYYQYGSMDALPYGHYPIQMGMSTFAAGQGYDPVIVWQQFNTRKNKYIGSKDGVRYYSSVSSDPLSSASTLSTGCKAAVNTPSLNLIPRGVGMDVDAHSVPHLYEYARSLGKKTAFVSNLYLGNDTAVGFSLHTDEELTPSRAAIKLISSSLFDVLMGTGHPSYNNNGQLLSYNYYPYIGSSTYWNQLLSNHPFTDVDNDGMNDPWTLIQTRAQFQNLITSANPPKRVIGIPPVRQGLQYYRSGISNEPFAVPLINTVPTLSEMSLAALNVVDDNPDGFLMIVSATSVEFASLAHNSVRMVEEMVQFNNTVAAVNQWVQENSSWDDTIVIVTSTCEAGYLTGPDSGLIDGGVIWTAVANLGQGAMPLMQWNDEDQTNSLVPFFAKGSAVGQFYFNTPAVIETPATSFGGINFFYRGRNVDPVHGRYLDNTDMIHTLKSILR